MQDETTFEKLVNELSTEERIEMLQKIEASVKLSSEPLNQFIEEEEINLVDSYMRFSFWQRLIILLKSIFLRKDKYLLVEEFLLARIARGIEKAYPGLISWKNGEIASLLYKEARILRESISVFSPYLRNALGGDKREYIAFLARLELPMVDEELLKNTDPFLITDERGLESDRDVKREMENRLDFQLDSLTEEERQIMYSNMQVIHNLNSLCFFPFEKILSSYPGHKSENPGSCSLLELRRPLIDLSDILFNLSSPPSMHLLESLFLYSQRNKGEDYDLEGNLKNFTLASEKALAQIRLFNRKIPLQDLLKLITQNVNYRTGKKTGGEDWFSLYKQYWKNRFELLYEKYCLVRKKNRITEEAKRFLHMDNLPGLTYYRSGALENVPVGYGLSISFLLGFVKQVFFKEINQTLKEILWDGEFYKEQNRMEFTDSYNGIVNALEEIKKLDLDLSPEGELGEAILAAKREMIAPSLLRKRVETVIRKADKRGGEILERVLVNLALLNLVVGGILFGEVGGKYDTLSNLGDFGKKAGQSIMVTLGMVHKRLERAFQILKELFDAETSMI